MIVTVVLMVLIIGTFLVGVLAHAITHGGQNSGYGKPPRWRRPR